ncbi:MAG: hypothetical protein KY475_18370 [Planctomycetes bacterium]|nr:hypothetical protein [Planctomycetota bacterium]
MSAATQSSEPRRYTQRREGPFWWGMFGGAIAWVMHLVGAYLLSEFGCESRVAAYSYLGIAAVTWSVIALSVAMVVAALGATLIAHRNRPPRDAEEPTPEFTGREYAAQMGVIANGAFTFVIVFESVPIFYYLQHC